MTAAADMGLAAAAGERRRAAKKSKWSSMRIYAMV
jgi:hypothetical protein